MDLPEPTNEKVFQLIFPKKEMLEYKPDVKYDINNIIHIQIVIYGGTGSGKTIETRSLVAEAIERYGEKNVCAAIIKGKLDWLLHVGINVDGENKMVQILVCDDMTLEKFDAETLDNFINIRHLMKAKTGRSNGLIITILNIHRFMYGVKDPLLRENLRLLLFRSSSSNPYDRNTIKHFIGDEGLNIVEFIEEEKAKDPKSPLWAYTYYYAIGGRTGVIMMNMPKEDYLKKIWLDTEPGIPKNIKWLNTLPIQHKPLNEMLEIKKKNHAMRNALITVIWCLAIIIASVWLLG